MSLKNYFFNSGWVQLSSLLGRLYITFLFILTNNVSHMSCLFVIETECFKN